MKMRGKIWHLIWLTVLGSVTQCSTGSEKGGGVVPEIEIIGFEIDGDIATLTYEISANGFTRMWRSSELGESEEWRQFSTSTVGNGLTFEVTFPVRDRDVRFFRASTE